MEQTQEIVDFNLYSMFSGLAFVMKPELEERGMKLVFNLDIDTDFELRGNCQRLGQTLANLIRGTLRFEEYGDVLFSVRSETLSYNRVLLQFEIQPTDGIGPRFRFYAGLPKKQ